MSMEGDLGVARHLPMSAYESYGDEMDYIDPSGYYTDPAGPDWDGRQYEGQEDEEN